jgi:hypothetical protein
MPHLWRHLWTRPGTAADLAALLVLISADRLPGEPALTPQALHRALAAGPARRPGGRGAAVERTEVVHDGSGQLLGAVRFSREPDGTGASIRWLHAREDRAVADALVRLVLDHAPVCTVYAFAGASPLPPGLPGLPVHDRAVTRAALEAAGFRTDGQWLYLHRQLPGHGATGEAPPTVRPESARRCSTGAGPADADGATWWIDAEDLGRHDGDPYLARCCLDETLADLAARGARDVICCVDNLAAGVSTTRTVLYDCGFDEVDVLQSFVCRR